MPFNNVPAYHKFTTAEEALKKHGFKHELGDPMNGARYTSKDHWAFLKWNSDNRYEVYVYKKN